MTKSSNLKIKNSLDKLSRIIVLKKKGVLGLWS